MKFIKYFIIVLLVGSLASCLKSKNDFAGLRLDNGSIVTGITEAQYLNTDGQNLGCGFQMFSNFNFSARPNENVKFFSLHIAQPRNKKVQGSLQVAIIIDTIAGYEPIDAALGVSTDPAHPTIITVPAVSTATGYDFPVKFAVNKTLLNPDPALQYAANFTIVSVNQGVFSELDKSIDVYVNDADIFVTGINNESDITGGYVWSYTLKDDANQFAANIKKDVFLEEEVGGSFFTLEDVLASCALGGSHHLYANNTVTGANTAFFIPEYEFDASGKVINIASLGAGSGGITVSGIVVDPAGTTTFAYVDNDHRSVRIKYSFTLTTTINGVVTPRNVTVTESFVYNTRPQAYYLP